jgi:hypothetical protein
MIYILRDSTVIEDNRELSCGVQIKNQPENKFKIEIIYSKGEFHISFPSNIFQCGDVEEFCEVLKNKKDLLHQLEFKLLGYKNLD